MVAIAVLNERDDITSESLGDDPDLLTLGLLIISHVFCSNLLDLACLSMH